jgi:hypothetical protein
MLKETKAKILSNTLYKLAETCESNSKIISDAINENYAKENFSFLDSIELKTLSDFQIKLITKLLKEVNDYF